MSNYTNIYMSGLREFAESKNYHTYDRTSLLQRSDEQFSNEMKYGNLTRETVKEMYEKNLLTENQIAVVNEAWPSFLGGLKNAAQHVGSGIANKAQQVGSNIKQGVNQVGAQYQQGVQQAKQKNISDKLTNAIKAVLPIMDEFQAVFGQNNQSIKPASQEFIIAAKKLISSQYHQTVQENPWSTAGQAPANNNPVAPASSTPVAKRPAPRMRKSKPNRPTGMA